MAPLLSPLRYPGSKRRLFRYIKKTLEVNSLKPSLYIEPFVGGASVALQLLHENLVGQVILMDKGPWIASFWQEVFFDTDWLINEIKTIDVTIQKWWEFKKSNPITKREQALTGFFLNRTSFSGILEDRAGPIGGKFQNSNYKIPQATIVVERGTFVVTEYCLELISVSTAACKIKISKTDTLGNENVITQTFDKKADLPKVLKDERLRGYKIVQLIEDGDLSRVVFGNGEQLFVHSPIRFQSEQGQRSTPVAVMAPRENYPVFNLIDRAAKETGLTRPTINAIFRALTERKKQTIFANPEGFASQFITEINNALADHVAERIEFVVEPVPTDWGFDLNDLFPPEKEFPQKELVEGSKAALYDQIQYDSEVERNFVINRLNKDAEVVFYFKFPPAFKIQFPRILGNYNPDWGIARYGEDGKMILELVRETKGEEELEGLQFPGEKRKIQCALKHFKAIGIDYRVVTDQVVKWWEADDALPQQQTLIRGRKTLL